MWGTKSQDRVHKPQLLKRKESRSGIEPRSFRLPAYRLTARPNRFSERQADREGIPVVRLRTEGPNAFKGPTVSKRPAVAYMNNDWSQTTIDSFYQSSGDSGHASSRQLRGPVGRFMAEQCVEQRALVVQWHVRLVRNCKKLSTVIVVATLTARQPRRSYQVETQLVRPHNLRLQVGVTVMSYVCHCMIKEAELVGCLVSNWILTSCYLTAQGHLRTVKLCYKQMYIYVYIYYIIPFWSQSTKPIPTQT